MTRPQAARCCGLQLLHLIFVASLSSGCASAAISNVKGKPATQPYSRIAIIVHGHDNERVRIEYNGSPDMLGDFLVEALAKEFQRRGVETKAWLVSPLELDPDAITAQVDGYGAPGLLVVQPSGGVLEGFGKIAELYYATVLIDTASKTVRWTATAENSNGQGRELLQARMVNMARKIGDSMAAYGYVPSRGKQ